MGSSREMYLAVLVEPAFLLAIVASAGAAGTTELGKMIEQVSLHSFTLPYVLAAVAFFALPAAAQMQEAFPSYIQVNGRAEKEIAPDEWLVIYGLADDQSRSILYAFGQYLTPTNGGKWLSIASLKHLLRKCAYVLPARLRLPAFRKLISHRLLDRKSVV